MTPILFGKRQPLASQPQYDGTRTEVDGIKGPQYAGTTTEIDGIKGPAA